MKSVYMANTDNSIIDDIAFIDNDDEDDSLSQQSYRVQKDGAERVGVFDYFTKPVNESSLPIGNSTTCSGTDNYYLGPRSTLPLANAGAKQFKQVSQHLNSKSSYQGSEWMQTSNESNWHFSTDSNASHTSKTANQYNNRVLMSTFDSSESDSSQERCQQKMNEQYTKHQKSTEGNSFPSQFDEPIAHFDTRVNFSLSKNASGFHSSSKASNSTEGSIVGITEVNSSRSRSMLPSSRNSKSSSKGDYITIDNGNKENSESSITSESRRTIDMMLGNGLSVMGNSGLLVPQYRLLNEDRALQDEGDIDYESKSVVRKLERMQRRRQARLEKQAVGLCKADTVPGFRGDESIDELVSYIDASQLPPKQKTSTNKQNKKKKATKRHEKVLEVVSNANKKSAGDREIEVFRCANSKPKISLFEGTDMTGPVTDSGVSETESFSSGKGGVAFKSMEALHVGSETSYKSEVCDNHGSREYHTGSHEVIDHANTQLTSSSVFDELVSTLNKNLNTAEDYSTCNDNDFIDAFVTVHRKKRVKNVLDGNVEKSIDFTPMSSSEQLHRPSKSFSMAGPHQRGIHDKRALSPNLAPVSLTRSFNKSWSNRSQIVESQFNKVVAKSSVNTLCVEDSSTWGTERTSDKSDANHNTEVAIEKMDNDDVVRSCSNILMDCPKRTSVFSDTTSQQQSTSQALIFGTEEVGSSEKADEETAVYGQSTQTSLEDLLITACSSREMNTEVDTNQPLKSVHNDLTQSQVNSTRRESKSVSRRTNQSVVFLDTQHLQDVTPILSDISFGFDPQIPSVQHIVADAPEESPAVTPVLHYVPGCPVVYCVPRFAMLPPVAFLPTGRCTPIGVVPPMPSEVGQTDLVDRCVKALNTVTTSSSCSSVFDLFSAQLFMHSEFQRTLESAPLVFTIRSVEEAIQRLKRNKSPISHIIGLGGYTSRRSHIGNGDT